MVSRTGRTLVSSSTEQPDPAKTATPMRVPNVPFDPAKRAKVGQVGAIRHLLRLGGWSGNYSSSPPSSPPSSKSSEYSSS